MIRQIIIPENNWITLNIPLEFIGRQIEIIAFPIQQENTQNLSWKSLKGKYKGKLSNVDSFIKNKQSEKMLEK